MSVERIWEAHRDGAGLGALRPLATTPEETFYLAMVAHCTGDMRGGAALAQQAAELDPEQAVYAETARYLRADERRDVYGATAAFTALASGGDNVGLYRAVHRALRAQYATHRPGRLLDIGTGEGHSLLGALTGDVGHVDVVEPSAQRLAVVAADLARRGVPHRAYAMTAQRFAAGPEAGPEAGPWDLVQETFALMILSRQDRAALFGWLRPGPSG